MKKEIIVFGKDSYNTLGLMRSMGQRGFSIYLILQKTAVPGYCRLSKYATQIKQIHEVEEGFDFLLHQYPSQGTEKTVIIPTSDLIASVLDEHYKELSSRYIFPNAGGVTRLSAIMDKHLMTEMAAAAGLSVPVTLEYVCGTSLPVSIPFPCMVKPAKSIEGSKSEMRVCYNVSELESVAAKHSQGHKLLLQQYIQKEFDILLLGCRCPNGKVFLSGIFQKMRWVCMGGDGSFGKITTNIEQWLDKKNVELFLGKLNYVGPFSIECGVQDGKSYFYEINLRNDGTSHYFDYTGFCVPYAWTMECMGETVPYTGKGEYYFIDEFGDIVNLISHKCSFKEWMRDRRNATALKYTNKLDRKPMMLIWPYMMAYVAKKTLKKTH